LDAGFTLFIAGLGLFDSLNPVTVAVGALLATTNRPARRLGGFVIGIFSVYLFGGLVLTLGPGELLDAVSPGPAAITLRDVVLLVVGVAAIGFGAWVLVEREAGRRRLPDLAIGSGSAFALGAAMTFVDLPTAFPYFAAIAAIVAEDVGALSATALLLLFNLMYVAPILLMLAAASVLQDRAAPAIGRTRDLVSHWAPVLLSVLSLGVGIALTVVGGRGLVD
jgi:cytochrome c biogenesis protein CcdA